MTDYRPIINLAGSVLIVSAALTISVRFGCFTGGLVLLWTWKQ